MPVWRVLDPVWLCDLAFRCVNSLNLNWRLLDPVWVNPVWVLLVLLVVLVMVLVVLVGAFLVIVKVAVKTSLKPSNESRHQDHEDHN